MVKTEKRIRERRYESDRDRRRNLREIEMKIDRERKEHISLYICILAGATRRCPGHYIKIIKCIVRAKVAR